MTSTVARIPIFATLLLTMSSAAVPAAAQPPLAFDRSDYAAAGGARGVTAADFNRDGWIDIAVANHHPDGISVLLNQRGTGFSGTFIPQAGGPFEITTGDLNNDGIPDIVVANADGNMINVAFGLGGGGFRTPLQIGAMGNPRGVTVSDVDRDGNQDLIYTQYYFQGVQVLFGDGQGNFDKRTIGAASVGPNPQGVVGADFNLDGLPDIAAAASGGVGLTILTRQPAGTYSRQDVAGAQYLNVLTVGDFDKDGRPDIAAASTATSEVFIYLNTRAQGWVLSSTRPSGSSPRGIEAVDLNRDGALDLVTGNRGSSTMVALLGDGRGGFPGRIEVPVASGGRVVAAADYNNDGRIDVATGNEYAAAVTVLTNSTAFEPSAFAFRPLRLGQQGTFFYTSVSTTDVADFDLDGRPDVVTQGRPNTVSVLLANGATATLPALGVPDDVKAGRFNGDANPDVIFLDRAIGCCNPTTLQVFLGDGAGRFPASVATPTGIIASQIETGDLNHDGRLDVVIAGDAGIVQVYLGAGDGRFTFGGNLYPDLRRSRVTLADIDRDGYLDIGIYSHEESSTASVEYRVNNRAAQPFFTRRQVVTFNRWTLAYAARFGDLNHDGYLDLVAIGGYVDTLAVALGGADGFAEPVFYRGMANISEFELVDLTMDGHLDLFNGHGELLAGKGDGTFAPPQRFEMSSVSPQIADFNRDGLPDVLTAVEVGAVRVAINQRTGTNTPPAVNAGGDWTMGYEQQFLEDEFGAIATGSDADMHYLTYQWTDAQGKVLSNDASLMFGKVFDPGRYEFFVTASDGRGGVARDSFVLTILPYKEIVLHVTPAYSTPDGRWSAVADTSAARGFRLHDVNAGAPKVTAPLAEPASYAEYSFVADPTQTYKLWVRLKAEDNQWTNDSLWLQFSGAVDANGRSVAPGTTAGIEVNLEECSGCGVSGWGWRDEAWGQRGLIGTVTLRFPQGGTQRVRMQTREDGVSIDQLVLSAEKYRTTRPGGVKDDATILPASFSFYDR